MPTPRDPEDQNVEPEAAGAPDGQAAVTGADDDAAPTTAVTAAEVAAVEAPVEAEVSAVEAPVETADVVAEPAPEAAVAPAPVDTSTPPSGRRAAPRPYPPSSASPEAAAAIAAGLIDPPVPPAPPAPVEPPAPVAAPVVAAVPAALAAQPAPAAPAAPVAFAAPAAPAPRAESSLDLLPEPPAKPGFGRHLLGVLLGLVLTPVGLLLTGIGTARLSDAVDAGDTTDVLGLSLLASGALVLGAVVLLGMWSPAVPITGGLLWGVGLGTAYLAVPWVMTDALEAIAGDQSVPAAVDQLTASAVTGQLLVTGVLLVAAGFAAARARRRGCRWAEGVALAQAARLEAARIDATRADRTGAGSAATAG